MPLPPCQIGLSDGHPGECKKAQLVAIDKKKTCGVIILPFHTDLQMGP